ncbi:MAG: hypothetical protein JXA90_01945 [Planctomycetes bacterium]|nr:hypothetical protein [Planctomycetota bacterium]
MKTLAASVRACEPPSVIRRAARALDCGFEKLVLEEPLYADAWEELRAWLPPETVAALRVFVPYPSDVRRGEERPFSLVSLRWEDRRDALRQAEATLQAADDLLARRILLPAVRVDLELAGPAGSPGRESPGFRRAFDVYRSFVYSLLERAERRAVTVCITPSCRADELPGRDELAVCLRELAGAPVGIWLDAGRLLLPEEETEQREPAAAPGAAAGSPGSSGRALLEGISVRDLPGAEASPPAGGEDSDARRLEAALRAALIACFDAGIGASGEDLRQGRELLDALLAGPAPESLFG